MTDAEKRKRWEETKLKAKEIVPEFSYISWIKPLQFIDIVGNQIVLEGSEFFAMSGICKRYTAILQQITDLTFGEEYEVVVQYPGGPDVMEMMNDREKRAAAMLNSRYTFETFVVGSNNRFAHAAAAAVAEMPAEAYNPLFLYGGVGLGKTHLMHAIGHYILEQNPNAKLLYLTSEEFTNRVISAIAKKKNEELRNELRNVDVLMVDDIQFIAGKTATQEEFFHTFNQLHQMKKQIVISSDRPPKEIPTLEERLRSRFEWGLVADIQQPDYETRIAILERKAEADNYDELDENVIDYIASNISGNVRELEGALTRVTAFAQLNHTRPTLQLAMEALSGLSTPKDPRKITADLIMEVVCRETGIRRDDMISSRRSRNISEPRQIAMYLCREMTGMSTTRIGDVFGGRDHTTVLHGCEKVEADIRNKPNVASMIDDLKCKIRNE